MSSFLAKSWLRKSAMWAASPEDTGLWVFVQSQILPWVCIMPHSYCLQSQALCFPKMSCFLFYFSRGLVSNPLLSCACRELPAEASSRCVETSESRTWGLVPELPLTHHSSGDGPQVLGITKDPWRQLIPVILTYLYESTLRWEGKTEEREKSERSLQIQRPMSTNCLKHHVICSLTFFSPSLKDTLR